jgi:hypothetical protein
VHSLHWFSNERFQEAVADYLRAEARAVDQDMEILTSYGPFRRGPGQGEEETE